jgi:glycine dehydrogenase subunit 1
MVELATLLARRTAALRREIAGLTGFEPLHEAPVVREFAVRSTEVPVEELRADGDPDGPRLRVYPLGREYPEFEDGFLVALTEKRTPADLEWLVESLEASVSNRRMSEPETLPRAIPEPTRLRRAS